MGAVEKRLRTAEKLQYVGRDQTTMSARRPYRHTAGRQSGDNDMAAR